MRIQVLGTGCPKCRETLARVERAAEEAGVDATLEKIEEIREIVAFGVLATPAVAIDGKVVLSGRLPQIDELVELLVSRRRAAS